ncbi:MAG: TolC family protein [Sulfurimonas sp.]|nr:TolC family protein [Sulfurimonas sp.]
MKTIILSFMFIINVYAAQNTAYHLDTFIQKALDSSFAIELNQAQIELEKANIDSSSLWKNPDFDAAFDNGLGNSVDYTYLELSQKLPAFGEIKYKKSSAVAGLRSATHQNDITNLQVQYRAAYLFSQIAFLKSQLYILDQQISKVDYLQELSTVLEEAGDLSGLEKMRIDIMREQIIVKKQRLKKSYLKAQIQAQSLLNIDEEISLLGDTLKPKKVEITNLISSLKKSSKYRLYESKVYKSKQELALTKTKLYALPEIYLYQERENNNKNIENIVGLGFRLSIPIWNNQDSQIEIKSAQINKDSIKAKEILYMLQRDVDKYYKLYQNALTQSIQYNEGLLIPSKKFYEVSRLSYEVGEKSLLELVDAQTLYFQSQLDYNTLIFESKQYWLQLYKAASINLLKENL